MRVHVIEEGEDRGRRVLDIEVEVVLLEVLVDRVDLVDLALLLCDLLVLSVQLLELLLVGAIDFADRSILASSTTS